MLIPTMYQMRKGRLFSRKYGPHSLQMYFRKDVYIIRYGKDSWGFVSYSEGQNKLLQLMGELRYVRCGR